MSKIKAISIDKSNLAMQFLCAILILAACYVSSSLALVAGVISMAYIFSSAKWEQKIALFMFLLVFSPIFNFEKGQRSLFIFLRLSIIISYVFQNKEKFSFTFITLLIAFTVYCFVLSEVFSTNYMVYLINIVLWTLIGYIIAVTLESRLATPVVRSFANGVIITGIIGLFLNDLPQIALKVKILSTYAQDGALVYRFAGFWSDPNYFSVLLITSLWTTFFEYSRNRIGFTENIIRCLLISFLGLMTMSKSCVLLLMVFWIYFIVAKNNIKTSAKVSLVFLIIFSVILFISKNPYWISDILYRFNAGNEDITLNNITTGRSGIWLEYFKRMLDDFSWIFGHGIGAEPYKILENSKGSHNAFVQAVYAFGLFGTVIYISVFTSIYFNLRSRVLHSSKTKMNQGKYALISLLVTLLFLDGIYIEFYYYLIPFSFIYLFAENEENISENTIA